MQIENDGRRIYNASLGNDGNHETHPVKDNKASCFTSQNEANPWWAVDLDRPTTVYRVDFTNVGHPYGMYSLEFRKVLLLFSSVHAVHG